MVYIYLPRLVSFVCQILFMVLTLPTISDLLTARQPRTELYRLHFTDSIHLNLREKNICKVRKIYQIISKKTRHPKKGILTPVDS